MKEKSNIEKQKLEQLQVFEQNFPMFKELLTILPSKKKTHENTITYIVQWHNIIPLTVVLSIKKFLFQTNKRKMQSMSIK